jgi:hypothetical protein
LVISLSLLLVLVTYTPQFLQKVLAASDTSIVAAGDWGCSDNTEKTVQNVKNLNPQLLLALGDFSYDKTSTCWLNIMKPLESITKISIGNHEVESDSLLNSYLNHFGLTKQYYSYDINNVHVLTMATEEEFEPNSDQYNYVVNDLRKAANNPDIKWIIVNMHNPFYSSPNGCKDSDCEGDKEYRESFHPLFDKYGVDLVLQGHVHNYQRSFPLKFNQESSSKPLVTSISKTDYENLNGAIYAIVGTGGVNLHGLSDKVPFMAYQQDSKFGILYMHFSDNKLDAKFVTNEGSTLDHFSISKTVKKKIIERISDNIVTDTQAKAVSGEEEGEAKPLTEEVEEEKPGITYKLDDDAATGTEAKPLTDKDTEAKPLTEEVEEEKPGITKELADEALTDDKPESLQNEDKAVLFDEDKSTDDKSDVGGLLGSSDKIDPVDDEIIGDDGEKTVTRNDRDPFAALN